MKKRSKKEPVLVLANGIGLWRIWSDTGDLSYGAYKKEADGTETMIAMAPSEWEIFVRSLESDAMSERQREMDERYR